MENAKVLIVEDDVHLLDGIRDILELEGYDVWTAQNGVQGLSRLKSESAPPDLIVSDIMMPEMDGIEFFKQVREEDRWLTIPFIFLTARGEKTDYYRGMRLGVDDYIIKPYDPADLIIKIESRLQRHRKLNEAHNNSLLKLKRQILTILNHEFRTPLTFVVAYADMLHNQDANHLSPAEIMSYLKGVTAGADRLRSLVENFMLLVELETGEARQTYDWRKCPIDDLGMLFDVARSRVKELQEGHNPCDIQIETVIPLFVGDPEYLVTAMAHLLANATKFSEPGKPIEIGARASDEQLQIWVRDYGRGIPASELSRIWDSFYQVDRAVYEDQGAGAGLAIAHGVARLHNGHIEAHSELGQGSTFLITLPIEKPADLVRG